MSLEDEIRAYVNLCHGDAWRRAGTAKPDEPALVSSFLSKDNYRGLRSILRAHAGPSTKVLVRGIFTHQTPKVLLKGKTQSVEIGDLMLVHQHFSTDPRKPDIGRALLFQAKRTRTPHTGSLTKGTEAIQFELYQTWPEFNGATRLAHRPDASTHYWNFNNTSVNSQPATDGADYLTIFKGHAYKTPPCVPQWKASVTNGPDFKYVVRNYPNASTWSTGSCPATTSPAKSGVSCKSDFGAVLTDFLLGNKGRDFNPRVTTPTTDHWSLFVNQMLAISARANGDYVYTSANQGVVSGMRGRNLGFLSFVPALFHAAFEELDEFVDSAASGFPFSDFVLTNMLLRKIESDAVLGHDGEPPVCKHENMIEDTLGGHVPLLLVTTYGPEGLTFNHQ